VKYKIIIKEKMKKAFKVEQQQKQYIPQTVLIQLMIWMGIVFAIDRIAQVWFQSNFWHQALTLSLDGLKSGKVWQIASYMFMHDGLWHIICNAFTLLFIGRIIEQRYGPKRVMEVFFLSGIMGALLWLGINFRQGHNILLGASAGCLGLFSYFCLIYDDRPLVFLFYFVLPIKLKPRILLIGVALIEVYCFFMNELRGEHIANSAHLGGILGGCLCYLFHRYCWRCGHIFGKKAMGDGTTNTIQSDSYELYITSYSAQRNEIDRILDKINESGFQSLTKTERNTLNSAKHLMHR
jgi:membrane associated rhomboid family serine protease